MALWKVETKVASTVAYLVGPKEQQMVEWTGQSWDETMAKLMAERLVAWMEQ